MDGKLLCFIKDGKRGISLELPYTVLEYCDSLQDCLLIWMMETKFKIPLWNCNTIIQ